MFTCRVRVDGVPTEMPVEGHWSLRKTLENQGFHLPVGCDSGHCGSCTVLLDGVPVPACVVNARTVDGADIATVSSAAEAVLVEEFLTRGAVQCGYCTPGMLVALSDLVRGSRVTDGEVREALVGHLCRCTGYQQIVEATVAAATRLHP